jgi:EAL domain-containing protein (putative c-di-GMP-specific phosphodiesterase class I)
MEQQAHTIRQNTNRAGVDALDVARAWALESFEVWYQPQHDLYDGRLIGAEALVRMRDSSGALVSPTVFLPHVHALGLTSAFGAWVLATALGDFATLDEAPSLSVNVCALQLGDTDATATLRRVVQESGFPSTRLTLEITEEHELDAIAFLTLQALHKDKIRLSIDDFGAGYAGFDLLSKVPVQEVKLDRSLTQRISEERTKTICGAIVALGNSLGIEVVAEGIEDASQAKVAQSIGCTTGQGYHYAKPMPFSEFADCWISAHMEGAWLRMAS